MKIKFPLAKVFSNKITFDIMLTFVLWSGRRDWHEGEYIESTGTESVHKVGLGNGALLACKSGCVDLGF